MIIVIGILIVWLISGILLATISGLIYYYHIIGLFGLSVLLALSIVILLFSSFYFISWQTKWKRSVRPYGEAMKGMFTIFIFIGILIFLLGVIGLLFAEMGIYELDTQTSNTLFASVTAGLFAFLGGIISRIYIERSMPDAVSIEITEQMHGLDKIKVESQNIGNDIGDRKRDVDVSLGDAIKIREKTKEEMKGK